MFLKINIDEFIEMKVSSHWGEARLISVDCQSVCESGKWNSWNSELVISVPDDI
jgi:hypothetical protein